MDHVRRIYVPVSTKQQLHSTVSIGHVYTTAIRPILLYASETWSGTSTATTEKVDAAERRFLRRICSHFYPDRPEANEVHKEANILQEMLTQGKETHFTRASTLIERSRLRFLGHVLRRPENRILRLALFLQPKSEWTRRRGAPRQKWCEYVKEQLQVRNGAFGRNRVLRRLWASPNWMESLVGVAAQRVIWKAVAHGKCSAAEMIIDHHAITSSQAD